MKKHKKEKPTKLGQMSGGKKLRFVRELVNLDQIIARIEYLEAEAIKAHTDANDINKRAFYGAEDLSRASLDQASLNTTANLYEEEASWLRYLLEKAHGHWAKANGEEVRQIRYAEANYSADMFTGEEKKNR